MYKFRTGAVAATSYRSFRKKIKPNTFSENASSMETFLLRSGLDKLPQLFNVMLGQMSLVGPRVVPLNIKQQYGPWLPGILAVKPGITGSWALKKTNALEQEVSLSYYGVSSWNIGEDFATLGQTLMRMIQTRFKARTVQSGKHKIEEQGVCPTERTKTSSFANVWFKKLSAPPSWFRGVLHPKRVYLFPLFSLIGIKTIFVQLVHLITRIDLQ